MVTSLVGMVVLLGGLIFFHESGHYLMAKFFGVKVEVFSLGFGKKIFRRQIGETEYALSLIPLGGYVKLMGDDPYKGVPAAEAERAFSTQKLYKRFLIVAAGPLANLLLAAVLFTVIFWIGQPVRATKIGSVVAGSPAWDAGLRSGDRITAVDSTEISLWSELEDQIKAKLGKKVELKVERGSTPLVIPYTVGLVRGRNVYGEDEEAGGVKGISPFPVQSTIGVSDPNSPAYVAGLRTGDTVIKVDSRQVALWEELKASIASSWKSKMPITISVKRAATKDEPAQEKSFTLVIPASVAVDRASSFGEMQALGIYPSELFVSKVSPGSPAEKGGLLAGDRVVKVGDVVIYNFETIVDQVQAAGEKNLPILFTIERSGKQIPLDLKPIETSQEDPMTREMKKRHMVGFVPHTALAEGEMTRFQIRQPIKLVSHALSETTEVAKRMVVSLFKLATGSVSVKNLGGPVLIASIAGKSLDAGIVPFLQTMALISINLFLLNLFPIPVLDGGHLLFFSIEAVKGKPVSIRTMELANQVGLVLILMLVALTFFNDISRIILH